MSDHVFLVDPAAVSDAAPGQIVVLAGAEGQHAVRVVRIHPGEAVTVVDGAGRRVRTVVESTQAEGRAELRVVEVIDEPDEALQLVVVQALPRGEHGELAVDLLTQAGVDVIIPWASEHAVAVWRGDKAERGVAKWQAAAVRAAKQSRRARIPRIRPLADTDAVIDLVRQAGLAVLLHETASTPISDLSIPSSGTVVLVVGPEGGISEREVAALSAAGATPTRMGATVLRSSFAGAAAVVAIAARARWGS